MLRFPQTIIVIHILTLNSIVYPEIYSSAALYATLYIFLELIGPIWSAFCKSSSDDLRISSIVLIPIS